MNIARSLLAILTVASLAACSDEGAQGLEPAGLAPVRIGMTPEEAAKALGVALTPRG